MHSDDPTVELLRSVSRTFSLSILALPAGLREPMAVAYLLARTSDTIADTADASVDVRARRLEDFAALLHAGADPRAVAAVQRDTRPTHAGERALVAALPAVLDRFAALPTIDRQETLGLLDEIIAGQAGDLRTFADPGRVTALADGAALEAYAQAVAGSVGEWWTRMCCRHVRRYSARSAGELLSLGAAFGRGLQFVNILRDLPADLRAGRCYLPADELRAAGVEPARLRAEPALGQPVFDRWTHRAREHLRAGRDYVRAIHPRRVRFACYVPWKLAERTLDLFAVAPPLVAPERVKLSRGTVRVTVLRGLLAAVSNAAVR